MSLVAITFVTTAICSFLQAIIVCAATKKWTQNHIFSLSTRARKTLLFGLFTPPFIYFVLDTGSTSFYERLWTSFFYTWAMSRLVPLASIVALIVNKRNEKRSPNV